MYTNLNSGFVKIPLSEITKASKIEYKDGEVYINNKLLLSFEEASELDEAISQEKFSDEFFKKLEKTKAIGGKIKIWREYRKISQALLAKKTKVKQAFISAIENNNKNPSLKTLKEISKALKCDIDDLISI